MIFAKALFIVITTNEVEVLEVLRNTSRVEIEIYQRDLLLYN